MAREGQNIGLVDRHYAALHLVGQTAKVAPPLGVVGQLPAHLSQQFAVVAHLNFGQPLGVLGDQIGQPQHQLATVGGGHAGPGARGHGPHGGCDGPVGILGAALGHAGPGLAQIRINAV